MSVLGFFILIAVEEKMCHRAPTETCFLTGGVVRLGCRAVKLRREGEDTPIDNCLKYC